MRRNKAFERRKAELSRNGRLEYRLPVRVPAIPRSGWISELRCNDCGNFLSDNDTGHQVARMVDGVVRRFLICGQCFVRPRNAPSVDRSLPF